MRREPEFWGFLWCPWFSYAFQMHCLETKQLTSFTPLVVSGLAGVWPTCFPSVRLYGDTGYKVLIPQTKPSWERSFQVSWHMLVMTPWHCGRENGDWWTKRTWTLLFLVRSPNICKATIWRTALPGSFVSADWWMNFKITWMCSSMWGTLKAWGEILHSSLLTKCF